MTIASPRAVSLASVSRLRTALLAAASVSLMGALVPTASAASCSTTAGNDSCVISISNGNTGDNHDGQDGTDTLQFGTGSGPFESFTYTNTAFTTAGTAQFQNFETAVVSSTALVVLNDNLDTDSSRALNWVVNSMGFLELNFTSTAVGDANNVIGDNSSVTVNAGGNFLSWENERIGALSGAGDVGLVGGTLSVLAGNNTFSGGISGPGNLTLVGNSGNKWTLSGDNSFTGKTTVATGTLEIANAGAIDQSSAVEITGGELTGKTAYNINADVKIGSSPARLTGNATIDGNVESNGGLQPGNTSIPPGALGENPGQDMGTITIKKNYTATGSTAYVGMFIDIDAAAPAGGTPGTTHDFLDIQGNYLGTNKTMFALASFDSAAVGAPTTGNGIQVIRIGGTNSGNDFYQGSAMNAGPYQYLLKYVADYSGVPGTADGYFLQSAVRDELVAHAAVISAGQALVRDCYHDDQRVPDSPKGATYGRAWIGYGRGSSTFGNDTGINSDVNFSCTTGGMDWRMGGGWFGGISGGFGDTDGNVTTAAGEGRFTGSGRSAELFASFTSRALFINLSAGYNAMDYTYNGALLSNLLVGKTAGFLATAQTGIALDLNAIAVKLLGQVSYDGTSCSDSCFGVKANEDSGLVEAKGTIRFDGVAGEGSIRPWAAVSFSDVLSNGVNSVQLGAVTVTQDVNSQLVSLEGGLQAYLDQNFALTLDGGYHESLTVDVKGYKAGIGLKMYW